MNRALLYIVGIGVSFLWSSTGLAIDAELYQKYQAYQSRQQVTQTNYLEQARAALQAGDLDTAQKQLDIAKNLAYSPQAVSVLENQITEARTRVQQAQVTTSNSSQSNTDNQTCEYMSQAQNILSSAEKACIAFSSTDALFKQESAIRLEGRAITLIERMRHVSNCQSGINSLNVVISLCRGLQRSANSAHNSLDDTIDRSRRINNW